MCSSACQAANSLLACIAGRKNVLLLPMLLLLKTHVRATDASQVTMSREKPDSPHYWD